MLYFCLCWVLFNVNVRESKMQHFCVVFLLSLWFWLFCVSIRESEKQCPTSRVC
jgi:hypothetical protein